MENATLEPGAFPWLVPGPVFKTGVGSGNRLQVGSIPIRSRQFAGKERTACKTRHLIVPPRLLIPEPDDPLDGSRSAETARIVPRRSLFKSILHACVPLRTSGCCK